jgi:CBS domain-containing protein
MATVRIRSTGTGLVPLEGEVSSWMRVTSSGVEQESSSFFLKYFAKNNLKKKKCSKTYRYNKPFIFKETSFSLDTPMPTVKDIMTKDVVTIETNKTVFEAAELMASSRLGCLIIVIKAFPVGIITERDIVHRVVAKRASLDLKVTEVMTKTLITVDPDTSLREAANLSASL